MRAAIAAVRDDNRYEFTPAVSDSDFICLG